jgi:hypothetical protein
MLDKLNPGVGFSTKCVLTSTTAPAPPAAVMARVALADVYRARKPKPKTPSLAELLANSSPAERIEAARALGVDVVWDTMIMPIVADEKASGPAA